MSVMSFGMVFGWCHIRGTTYYEARLSLPLIHLSSPVLLAICACVYVRHSFRRRLLLSFSLADFLSFSPLPFFLFPSFLFLPLQKKMMMMKKSKKKKKKKRLRDCDG
ncbi:hypothetical protein F4802DRAFT_590745 [Xylaria palmicola]|nr:hypothetical protein F4802DRAFT_590745 [Xylaria palmicola]